MMQKLKELLSHIENTIDKTRFDRLERLHASALDMRKVERLPVIASYPYPMDERFVPFPHGEIFDDPEKMLFNQLVSSFDSSVYLSEKIGDDLPVTVRADFGCVMIASMFGAVVEQVGDNPPWIRQNGHISYENIIDISPTDFNRGIIAKVAARYQFYKDVLKDYPALSGVANIVMPDLQGPVDNLELLIGSGIFEDMYLKRDLFLKAMDVVTQAQIELVKYFGKFVNSRTSGISFQHGFPLKGGLLIRDDTSIMVSPQMYRELIAPYDERLLEAFGGGIHSCGNVNGIVREFISLRNTQCFDFGQSEMNDVENIYQFAKMRDIPLIRVAVSQDELVTGSIMNKYPTGVSLIFRAASFENAKNVVEKYKTVCGCKE